MDDPKTYRWQRWSICRTSSEWVNIYLADDPAIVAALSIAKAAREAGLVDGDRLRKPDCYWRSQDNEAVLDPHDDMSFHADVGEVEWYRPAWGGPKQWWVKSKDLACRGPFDTREAAERAAGGGEQ